MPARIVVALLALAALLIGAPTAHAREGVITATSSADWNTVSFAGSATWDSCPPEDCLWQPYVTTQPVSTPCQIEAPYSSSNPNVRVAWAGTVEEAPAKVSFTVTGAPLVPGLFGQKLCLIAQGSIGEEAWLYDVLASRVIDGPAPPPPPPPPPAAKPQVSAACKKARAAKKRAQRRLLALRSIRAKKKWRVTLRRTTRKAKRACA